MVLLNAVDTSSGEPPVDEAYHAILLPVAVRSATVGFRVLQKFCGVVTAGAAGVIFTVAATSVLT